MPDALTEKRISHPNIVGWKGMNGNRFFPRTIIDAQNKRREEMEKFCAVCGRLAIFRVKKPGGGVGACRAHRGYLATLKLWK